MNDWRFHAIRAAVALEGIGWDREAQWLRDDSLAIASQAAHMALARLTKTTHVETMLVVRNTVRAMDRAEYGMPEETEGDEG